jgi:predicted nucleic acid-binding protein
LSAHVLRRADAECRCDDPSLEGGPLTLAVDASVLLAAALGERAAQELAEEEIIAPPLAWSEAMSVLHEGLWRRERPRDATLEALRRLWSLRTSPRSTHEMRASAWRIADQRGWAKTYDAEYLALAATLRCDLATFDAGLRDGAVRVGVRVRWLA